MSESAIPVPAALVADGKTKELKPDVKVSTANNIANDSMPEVMNDVNKEGSGATPAAGRRRKRVSELAADSSLVIATPTGVDSNRRQTRSQTRGTPAPTPAKKPALEKPASNGNSTPKSGRRGRPPKNANDEKPIETPSAAAAADASEMAVDETSAQPNDVGIGEKKKVKEVKKNCINQKKDPIGVAADSADGAVNSTPLKKESAASAIAAAEASVPKKVEPEKKEELPKLSSDIKLVENSQKVEVEKKVEAKEVSKVAPEKIAEVIAAPASAAAATVPAAAADGDKPKVEVEKTVVADEKAVNKTTIAPTNASESTTTSTTVNNHEQKPQHA